jgi:hypothetical protein
MLIPIVLNNRNHNFENLIGRNASVKKKPIASELDSKNNCTRFLKTSLFSRKTPSLSREKNPQIATNRRSNSSPLF